MADLNPNFERLSGEVIGAYLAKKGQKANPLLSVLGKRQPFIEAMSTTLGRELLDDALVVMQEIMQKIWPEAQIEVDVEIPAALEARTYKYDILMTDTGGDVTKLLFGEITIRPTVTELA